MRIVGVPVVDRHPVQPGAEILGHVGHQLAGECPQVRHVARIFGTDDEAEVVPVILATIGEAFAITLVRAGIEHGCIASVAGQPVAFEIGDMASKRCGAIVCALVPDDASQDSNPSLTRRAVSHSGKRKPTSARSARASASSRPTSA